MLQKYKVLLLHMLFIIAVGFPGSIQRKLLTYWNINVLCHNVSVDCCDCLPSILYFTCWTPFVVVFFLFHWLPSCIVFVDCLNVCEDSLVIQLIWTDHLHAYNRLLKTGMIWCKKNSPHFLINQLNSITNKSLVLK